MTLAEALQKVASEIDVMIARRLHANVLKMVECGHTAEDVEEYLAGERERVAPWRAETLNEIESTMVAEARKPW